MTHTLAVALGYRPETDLAPRVVAVGEGAVAERILRIAREHEIPLEADPHLARLLAPLALGDEVPPELYAVVARVFAYLEGIAERLEESAD